MKYSTYQKPKKTLFGIIATIIFVLICIPATFVVGVMFYCNNILEYYPIDGKSMQPLLNPNGKNEDFVYIQKGQNVSRGNVIIYNRQYEDGSSKKVIKRVIAVAGDNVMIKKNDDGEFGLYIQFGSEGEFVLQDESAYIPDSAVYKELYIEFYEKGSGKVFQEDENHNKYLHIEENYLFYLGDNRLDSNDCLDYGAQQRDKIVGKVLFIIHKDEWRVFQVIAQMLGIDTWK